MKNLITHILIFLTTTLILISGEWKTVYNEGTLIQWDLGCADSMNCISLGAPSGTGTRLIKTTDGGYNWEIIYNNVAEKIYNDEGQWVDTKWPDFNAPRSLAYLTQDLVVVGRTGGQITISKDGGYTWEGVQLSKTEDVNLIKFSDSLTGIALTDHFIFLTIDGGYTWENIRDNINYSGNIFIQSGYILDDLIYAGGFFSTDKGETWTQSNKVSNISGMYGVHFINSNEGWACGRRQLASNGEEYSHVILHTTNSGLDWETQVDTAVHNAPYGLAYGIYFADKNNGITWSDRVMWTTTNGGEKWDLEITNSIDNGPFNDAYIRMVLPSNTLSKRIASTWLTGVIMLYEDLTSVEDNANLENLLIFPNPAGDFINISIDSDEGLLAREVQILDLLGLVVSKKELTDGNNRIDISNLPRGTYFIKIGDKVEKFVKM